MLFVGKGNKQKFASTKAIPSDKSTLTMKTIRINYVSLNPEKYGWQKLYDMWVSLWFGGPPLPSLDELDELDDVHEDVDTN